MTTLSTTHKPRQSLLFLSFITLKITHILLLVLYHQLLICKRGATLHTNSTDMTTKQNNSCGSIQLNPIKPLNLNSQEGLLRRSLVVAGRAVMFEMCGLKSPLALMPLSVCLKQSAAILLTTFFNL